MFTESLNGTRTQNSMVIFFPNFSLTENKQTKLNNLFISRNVRMGKDAEDATFSHSL